MWKIQRNLPTVLLAPRAQTRKGGILVLMAVMLTVVVILAALAINVAYLELNRTEMYVAADAAARAGGREFTLTNSQTAGRNRAIEAASRNLVRGRAPTLASGDMVFGESTRSALNSRYSFTPGGSSPNALQVTIDHRTNSANGGLPVLLDGILGTSTVSAAQTARSTQLEVDIALVIDRSGSMAYAVDELANPYQLPRNAPNPFRFELQNQLVTRPVLDPVSGVPMTNATTGFPLTHEVMEPVLVPIPWDFCDPITFSSRWLDLTSAVSVFINEVSASATAERLSLVTYSTAATIDANLTTSYGAIQSALGAYTSSFCGGATNISDGIRTAQNSLAAGNSRPWASKVMILMTDGIATAGGNPQSAANNAADEGILIFTVTFSNEADQSSMQRVAAIGNGKHYHATSSAALEQAFLDIARQIPVVLTQ